MTVQEFGPSDWEHLHKKFEILTKIDIHQLREVCAENTRPDGNRAAVVQIFLQQLDTLGAMLSAAPPNVANAEKMGEMLDKSRERFIARYTPELKLMECYFPGLAQEVQQRLFGRTEHWKAVALLNALTAGDASPVQTGPQADTSIAAPATTDTSAPEPLNASDARRKARAKSVANVISELNTLKPQLFDDDQEYARLENQYPDFTCFQIAKRRPDLKLKLRSIQGSRKHVRLAQEIVADQYGLAPATIKDDWKDYKPVDHQNGRHSRRQRKSGRRRRQA